jgi:hypothetical protein
VTNNVVRSAYCNNPPGGHNLCAKKITDVEFARGWTAGETENDGTVYIHENNRRRIVNLDESNISLDGAAGNAGGRPSFTIWNARKPRRSGVHNKSLFTATIAVARNVSGELLPPHFQTTASKTGDGFHDIVTHCGLGIPTACPVTFGKNAK